MTAPYSSPPWACESREGLGLLHPPSLDRHQPQNVHFCSLLWLVGSLLFFFFLINYTSRAKSVENYVIRKVQREANTIMGFSLPVFNPPVLF